MKLYSVEDQLRIVGKGWEVKNYLRKLSKETNGGNVALASMLSEVSDRTKPEGPLRIKG